KLQQTSDKGNNECRSVSDLKERFEILIEIEKPPVSSIDAPASVQPGKIATGDPEPFEGAISTNESLESVLKNPAVSSIDAHASIQPAGITATTNREPLRARVSRSQSFQVNTEICMQLGISRSVTSAYHPQTNGLDERTNQTLKMEDPLDEEDIKPEDPSAEEFEEMVAERADMMKSVRKK
ncbi:myosin-1 isoform X3, partial [Paramuricea clavata]